MQLRMASAARHHLVLLPGLEGSGDLFEPLLASLGGSFVASVARHPNDRPLGDRDLFAHIRSVIPWGQPYVLVAESSAASTALRFAEAQRQDIQAIVLAAGFVSKPAIPAESWPERLLSKPWFEKALKPELIQEHLLGLDAPPALVETVLNTLSALPPAVWSWRKQLLTNLNAAPELANCERPLLYLRPAEDRFVSAEAVEELRRAKPSMKVTTLAGPHLILQRNPRAALQAIREFLEDLPSQ